jgi:site-specific DNA-methyltransferase (adenine-specific)
MPDGFVDCIICSPPYYQLRCYSGVPDSIWDGNNDCEHDYLNKTIKKSNGESARGEYQNSSYRFEATSGTCVKCGAWKGQLGLEPTYQMYLNHLLVIMAECKRVLKPEGTMWINLGDSYSGSNCGSND